MGLELFKALGDEKPSRFLCLVQTMKLMRHLFPQLGKLMAEKPTAAKKGLQRWIIPRPMTLLAEWLRCLLILTLAILIIPQALPENTLKPFNGIC